MRDHLMFSAAASFIVAVLVFTLPNTHTKFSKDEPVFDGYFGAEFGPAYDDAIYGGEFKYENYGFADKPDYDRGFFDSTFEHDEK